MDGSLSLKIAGLLLIINAIYASFAHRKGKLTIYVDWTDAVITGASPLIALALDVVLISFFNVPQHVAEQIAVGVFCTSVYFGLRLSWRANSSFGAFVSASAARYTVLALVYLAVLAAISSGQRKKYERESTAAKRKAAAIAATVAAYAAWSVWVSRTARFTPVSNWFAGDSHALLVDADDSVELQARTD